MKVNSFKDLIVWQKSMTLVKTIYALTRKFPSEERYALTSQLQRAVVSIPANIAEGWGRDSTKSYIQFLRISKGSLMETETLVLIANSQGYLLSEFEEIQKQIEEVSKMLNGLIKSLEAKTKEG